MTVIRHDINFRIIFNFIISFAFASTSKLVSQERDTYSPFAKKCLIFSLNRPLIEKVSDWHWNPSLASPLFKFKQVFLPLSSRNGGEKILIKNSRTCNGLSRNMATFIKQAIVTDYTQIFFSELSHLSAQTLRLKRNIGEEKHRMMWCIDVI